MRSLRRAVVCIAVTFAGCHSTPPHRPGEEWLASIKFEGNHELSSAELADGLALQRTEKAGRPPDPYQVETDTARLEGQYLRAGFLAADVRARVVRHGDQMTVIYSIDEGTRARTRVVISGLPNDPAIDRAKLRAQLPLSDGAPFVYDVFDTAKVKLLGIVQDAGYAHAKLDASVAGDVTTNIATISLAFTTGPKCTFGRVDIEGVTGDLRDAIVDRLHFKSGDTYSTDAVTATQREIYGLNRFSTVQVQPEPGDGAVVDMKVAVSEGAAHEVMLGGGFGIDPITYQVMGRAGYQVTGWPTPLDTFTLDLRPAYAYLRDGSGFEPRMRALAKIERQDLFLTHAVGSVEVGYDYLTYEAFTQYGPEAQLGYEMQLGSRMVRLRVGYLFHDYDFRDISVLVDPALQQQLGIDHSERVGGLTESLIIDLRDNPVEPRYGAYAEMKAIEGEPIFGGAYTFQEIVPELRGYLPLGPVVLAARARYGAIFGEVPPTERFYAGGATSQRGFAERELSPSVTGPVNGETITVPYGGAGLIDTSVEARFPLATFRKMPLGGVVFLDGGDVTDLPSQLDLSNLNWAVGFGLRLKTVVGPVRADIGYRLNRTGPDDPEPGSTFAFHISLGEAY